MRQLTVRIEASPSALRALGRLTGLEDLYVSAVGVGSRDPD
jgi:hypothetical protein